jgi:chemotaxis protein CheD
MPSARTGSGGRPRVQYRRIVTRVLNSHHGAAEGRTVETLPSMHPVAVPAARTGASPFLVVGVADLQASSDPTARIVTYALGSCIALTLYDPVAKVGGMLHYMLARPSNETDAELNPCLYASSGVPLLLRTLGTLGADRARLVGCAIGAAEILNDGGPWDVGSGSVVVRARAEERVLWRAR